MSNVLCAFLIFTIGAYGMSIRDYLLIRIAIFVFFYLQTSCTNPDRYERSEKENVDLGILLGRIADLRLERMSFSVEWAVWRRYYLSRNASGASSGLESKWRRGGEVAGSPSLTTRNSMEPAIEVW